MGHLISLWTFFSFAGEVIGSHHHQPTGSNQSGVSAGGQSAVNFFHMVGVLASAKRLRGPGHDIIYSLDEELKVLDFV